MLISTAAWNRGAVSLVCTGKAFFSHFVFSFSFDCKILYPSGLVKTCFLCCSFIFIFVFFLDRSGQCCATAFVVLMLGHLHLLIYNVQAALLSPNLLKRGSGSCKPIRS